jgi:hypothetical protein
MSVPAPRDTSAILAAMDADVWAAYARAEIDLVLPDGPRLTFVPAPPGTVEGAWPFDGGETLHVITAWNPGSRQATAAQNARQQGALEAAVAAQGLRWLPAVGRSPDGTWQEESMAIRDLPRADAVALGRRFGQRALYELSATGLTIVGCMDDARQSLGWRSVSAP